jgi:alpha-1,2-mannosyltransferase
MQAPGWAVVAPCLVDALVLGQSDPINVCLVSAGLLAVQRGRGMTGVGLVGVAGLIKILPILHWATIVSRCRSPRIWAAMALTALFGFGLVAGGAGWREALIGINEQVAWIRDYEKPWQLVARGADLRVNNESLPIVLARTFGDLGGRRPVHSLSLARLPLGVIWLAWETTVAILGITWLACAIKLKASRDVRAWLGMFSLTSILMLASTPICWHHYFLWLLPGTLFLADRPALLCVAAALSWLGTAFPIARGLGVHMLLALGLFAVVANDLWRRVGEPDADRV